MSKDCKKEAQDSEVRHMVQIVKHTQSTEYVKAFASTVPLHHVISSIAEIVSTVFNNCAFNCQQSVLNCVYKNVSFFSGV